MPAISETQSFQQHHLTILKELLQVQDMFYHFILQVFLSEFLECRVTIFQTIYTCIIADVSVVFVAASRLLHPLGFIRYRSIMISCREFRNETYGVIVLIPLRMSMDISSNSLFFGTAQLLLALFPFSSTTHCPNQGLNTELLCN